MDEDLARYRSEYHAHLYHLSRGGGAIAGWTVERVLGRGGFGAVAKVHQRGRGAGALKLAHPKVCDKEASLLRKYGGNTIPLLIADPVELSEVDFPAGCYVMELADLTLAQYFAGDETHSVPDVMWCSLAKEDHYRRIYDWVPYERREQDALAVAGTVLVALGKAKPHRHLDLCPSNVLLFGSEPTTWTPKVADWGNERVYEDGGETSYTLIGGKELWCPPRTRAYSLNRPGATPEPPTDKTDLYGLGALICWILTGTVPDQLARWDVHNDPDSGVGLPLDQIGQAWHEFVVATTRSDRHQRINRDEAMDLLATNRSIVRRSEEHTAPISPPDITTILRLGVPAPPGLPYFPPPPRSLPKPPRHPAKRWRPVAVLSAVIALAATVVVPFFLLGGDSVKGGDTQPLCVDSEMWCLPQLLDHLADSTVTTSSNVLNATVRDWYRWSLTRLERVNDDFEHIEYEDLAVLRLNFSNPTTEDLTVATNKLGLVVALPDGTSVPEGLFPISAPDREPGDPTLAWVPPLPPGFEGPSHLMVPTTVPADTAVGGEFPYTVLFDLSHIGSMRIVGLGSGEVRPKGASLLYLEPAHLWRKQKDYVSELYVDLGANPEESENSTGKCYVELYDVGHWFRTVDCDLPHHGEVIGTTWVQRDDVYSVGYDPDVASDKCFTEFVGDTGVDWNLSLTIGSMPSATPPQGDYATVHCFVNPGDDTPLLWNGPQSEAARNAG